MPAFFVWSRPSYVVVIDAVSEHEAAQAFLELPVIGTPERDVPPDCFVEPVLANEAPQSGTIAQFWVAIDGSPI